MTCDWNILKKTDFFLNKPSTGKEGDKNYFFQEWEVSRTALLHLHVSITPLFCDIFQLAYCKVQFYGYHQLQENFMGKDNLGIMGIEDIVIFFYGNRQLQKKIMEHELWNKKTSKLWI